MVKESKDKKEKGKSKKETSKKVKVSKTKSPKKPGFFKRISNWFGNVGREIAKVKWVTKKDMLKYSIATIVFVIFFSLFFYGIEIVMAWLKTLIV